MALPFACRICFEEEEDCRGLISPCDCRGSQKYVHRKCLQHWQTAIQVSGNPRHAYFCQVCRQKFTCMPEPVTGQSRCQLAAWYASLLMGGLLVMVAQRSLIALLLGAALLVLYAILVFICLGVKPLLVQDGDGRLRMYLTRFGRPVPGLYAGQVLVHQGPHVGVFGGSVVLLTTHSAEGTVGFIINKPISDAEYARYQGPASFVAAASHRGVGGPVSSDEWTVLHLMPNVPNATEVCPGVFTGGSAEALAAAPPGSVKVVSGTACWAPQQLDGEIRAGYWTFMEVPPEELFRADVSGLWDDLQRRTPLPIM